MKLAVLDGGHQIILANWPSYKRILCTHNNNIPVDIPSHPYVLLDRSILCNCDIEAESNFLLESLVACGENEKSDLEMYFIVNLAFVDYLDQLNETIDTPVIRNWTNQKQILPISSESFEINSSLLQAPKTLKEFVNQYREKRKLMEFQEKAIKEKQNEQNSKFRTFVSSFIADTLVFSTLKFIMILILVIVTILAFGKLRKSRIFRGQLFSNMVKIKLFIADTQSCVPINLNKIAGNVICSN